MIVVFLTAVTLTIFVLIWWQQKEQHHKLLATIGVVAVPDFHSAHLDNARPLTIFLPPHYQNGNQTYSSLYVNDGQDAEALKLRQTLASLISRKRIQPLIVIAIPTNEDRLQEYGTAVAPEAKNLGTKAAAYGRFVTEEVMPYIQQNFRVKEASEVTAVLGASLGGLAAFDLAWNYPEKFGSVGVLSGSFWWRASADEAHIEAGRRIAHSLVRRGPKRQGLRFWFQAATQDETADRDNNGVIDAIQDTLELIEELEKQGCKPGQEIRYREVAGGRHNYHTWSKILPEFLEWAFPI